MATVSKEVSATAEKPLLNKLNLTLGVLLYLSFYSFIRWYEGVYGWSAGLDSFAPEFETYWMNMLYIEIVAEVILFAGINGYIWKSRDRAMIAGQALAPREELRRHFTHWTWLVCYGWAIYWGASYFTEQDGTWHQTIVREIGRAHV